MANEKRTRTNGIGGLVEDNPLTSGATTLTSAGLAGLPVIDTTNHAAITIDPEGLEGNTVEIIYVTAHTASATTATVARGQEGTNAVAHSQDVPWVHGPTIKDFDASGGGVGLIGLTQYNPAGEVDTTTSSSTHADIDATNLVVAFTGPPSGRVLIRLTGQATAVNSSVLQWSLRTGGSVVTGTTSAVLYAGFTGQSNVRVSHACEVTGLTAGTAYSYTWGHARSSGASTTQTGYGGAAGPAVMEVWAVNL